MTRGVPRNGERRAPSPPSAENPAIAQAVAYNPVTGDFTWRASRSSNARAGERAGSAWLRKGDARYVIRFEGRGYQANRVAWLIMTGDWPRLPVDHVDGDGLNNRWANLRLASISQNNANARRRRDNTSGFKGVSRRGASYEARIQHEGRRLNLGRYDTAEEAHAAYAKAAQRLFGKFGRVA